MKKYIPHLLLVVIVCITSCKKEITCTCYVTTNSTGIGSPQQITIKIKSNADLSTKQKACEAEGSKQTTATETWDSCSMQ